LIKMLEQRSRMRSGAPFMTNKWLVLLSFK
jgi:hypothetical protein